MSQPSPIQFGIANDNTLFRKALLRTIAQSKHIEVVLEATDGEDLLNQLRSKRLDVLLLDLSTSLKTGKEVLKLVRERYNAINIVFVSLISNLQYVNDLLDIGIYAYISKNADIEELFDAINSASRGEIFENKIMTDALYWKANHSYLQRYQLESEAEKAYFLNRTQKKVLELLWEEKNVQQIAREIFTSVSTVEKIKQSLKEKTGAKSTIGLLKYAINKNIISPYL